MLEHRGGILPWTQTFQFIEKPCSPIETKGKRFENALKTIKTSDSRLQKRPKGGDATLFKLLGAPRSSQPLRRSGSAGRSSPPGW